MHLHSESFEDKLQIFWLADANGSISMPFDVYSKELSCGAEIRDSILLHESRFDVVNGSLGVSWIENFHVIDIEKEIYAATIVEAPFDVQVRIGQGLYKV